MRVCMCVHVCMYVCTYVFYFLVESDEVLLKFF